MTRPVSLVVALEVALEVANGADGADRSVLHEVANGADHPESREHFKVTIGC